jgi:WD40 repeat protein
MAYDAPPLPAGCRWHAFLSHSQGSGGGQALLLRETLAAACPSLRLWFDQDEEATENGMAAGVAGSATFLLFLSSGVLQRPFCLAELAAAGAARRPFVVVHESDAARGGADVAALLTEGRAAVAAAAAAGAPSRATASDLDALAAACSTRDSVISFQRGAALGAETLPALLRALGCAPRGAGRPPAAAPPYRLRRRALPAPDGAHVCVLAAPVAHDAASFLAAALPRLCRGLSARTAHEWEAAPEQLAASSRAGVLILTASAFDDARTLALVHAFRAARRPLRLLHEADPRHGGAVAFGDIMQAAPPSLRAGRDGGLFGAAIAEVLERRREKRELMLEALLRGPGVRASREGEALRGAAARVAPPAPPLGFRAAPVAAQLAAARAALCERYEHADAPLALGAGGAGGAGKSALAAALVAEAPIKARFDDVLWLTLGAGTSPQALLAKLLDALEAAAQGDDEDEEVQPGASASSASIADVPAACAALCARLARRAVLLVADDVADGGALRAALDCVPAGGPSRLLVTTRDLAAFDAACRRAGVRFQALPLPPLAPAAAAALLRDVAGVGRVRGAAEAPLDALAALAGATPLSVALVGGALRTHVEKPPLLAEDADAEEDAEDCAEDGAPAAAVAREARALLRALAEAALPDGAASDRDEATFRAVSAALSASFAPADVDKYALLGALPPKAAAPGALCAAAWRMPPARAGALLDALQSAALLKHDAQGRVTLHDLQAGFAAALLAQRRATAAAHAHLLARLAAALHVPRSAAAAAGSGETTATHAWHLSLPRAGGGALAAYAWEFVPFHLAGAGQRGAACGLLLTLPWLAGTLARRGAAALFAELARPAPASDADCVALAGALRLSPSLRSRDGAAAADALPAQLYGRLGRATTPRLRALAAACAAAASSGPRLRTLAPSLAAPGSEDEASLVGHTGRITALVPLPPADADADSRSREERLLSASADGTLRVWNATDGACLLVLNGHTGGVTAAVALGPAAAASASEDGTLRLWSTADGTCERVIAPHGSDTAAVTAQTALAALPPSADADAPLRLLSGDAAGGVALWLLPRSGADAPRCVARCVAPPPPQCATPARVTALATCAGGATAASCHACDVVFLWAVAPTAADADTQTAPLALLRALHGHTGAVTSACALRGGALLTGAWDRSLRLWDPSALDARTTTVPADYTSSAGAAAVYEDATPAGRRTRGVACVASLPDAPGCGGREGLLAGYHSGLLALWRRRHDGEECEPSPVRVLRAGAAGVTALAALRRGRAAAGAADGALRLFDLRAPPPPRPHAAEVHAAVALTLPSRTVVATGGADGLLRVWDAATGTCVGALRVVAAPNVLSALLPLRCGDLLVAEYGIRMHRIAAAALVDAAAAADGADVFISERDAAPHMRCVVPITTCGRTNALAALRRGRVAGGGWHNTVGVWDASRDGAPLAELKGHADAVTCLAALLHRGAREQLLSGGKDGTLRLWTHTDESEAEMNNDENDDERHAADASAPAAAQEVWACVRVLAGGHAAGAAVTALVLLPKRRAASAGEDSVVAVWALDDANDGADEGASASAVPLRRSAPLGAPLLSLALAAASDGAEDAEEEEALWAGAADGGLHRVRVRDGAHTLEEHGLADASPLRALCVVAPSGTLFAGTGRGDVHAYALAARDARGGGAAPDDAADDA